MALLSYNKEDNQLWFWSNAEKTVLENKKYFMSKLVIELIGMKNVHFINICNLLNLS